MSSLLDDSYDFLEIAIGDDYERSNIVMLRCIAAVQDGFPDIANEAISVAKKYWCEKSVSSDKLNEQRIKCWQYLDDNKETVPFDTKEHQAIRATICMLSSEGSNEDMYEGVDYFLEKLSYLLDSDAKVKDTVISVIKTL